MLNMLQKIFLMEIFTRNITTIFRLLTILNFVSGFKNWSFRFLKSTNRCLKIYFQNLSQTSQSDERSEMDRKFSDQIEKLVHEIVSVPVEDFNLTTKLNRAASFQ